MAEVVVSQNVVLKVTDAEWKLIMKALAAFAGVKNLTPGSIDKERAAALNKQLLGQRVSILHGQLLAAEAALTNTESEDPDGSAAAQVAFDVGRKIGEGESELT